MKCDATSVLAYLFWHRPSAGTEDYERRLAAFHDRLRADPPDGFVESAVFAVDVPWLGAGYEDWYVVEDWTALGVLNAAAVDEAHRREHDDVAHQAAHGAGGVFLLRTGNLGLPDAGNASWSGTEPNAPEAGEFALWQRQMVLGPAPEYVVHTRDTGNVSRVFPPATKSGDHELS